MQLHPGLTAAALDPTLAFRDFQLLKLKHDKLLPTFAFNCKMRHYVSGNFQDIDAAAGFVQNRAELEVLGVPVEVRIEATCVPVPPEQTGGEAR